MTGWRLVCVATCGLTLLACGPQVPNGPAPITTQLCSDDFKTCVNPIFSRQMHRRGNGVDFITCRDGNCHAAGGAAADGLHSERTRIRISWRLRTLSTAAIRTRVCCWWNQRRTTFRLRPSPRSTGAEIYFRVAMMSVIRLSALGSATPERAELAWRFPLARSVAIRDKKCSGPIWPVPAGKARRVDVHRVARFGIGQLFDMGR